MIEGQESQAGARMRSTSIRRTTVAVVLVLLALVLAFAGFANVIDALGGVTLDVEERMLYHAEDTVIDLKPGVQHLDGDKALQYGRFRANGVGDFGSWGGEEHGRVARQKKLLKAVIAQTPSIRNAWRLPKVISVVQEAVSFPLSFPRRRECQTLADDANAR